MSRLSTSHHLSIIDTVNRYGLLLDLQEWDELRSLLGDKVWIDHSDLDGMEPERVPKETLIRAWKEMMSGFESVQHVISNHCVDVQTAHRVRCRAHTRTRHHLTVEHGANSWTLGGTYNFGFERMGQQWKIIRVELRILWSDGNPNLFHLAVERGQKLTGSIR